MDQEKKCVDCRALFIIEAGEKQWFKDKGLVEPRRCKPCRIIKKNDRNRDEREERKRSDDY